MKNKVKTTPRTIADLKFDWEITYENHSDTNLAEELISTKNPHLVGLKIKREKYTFLINDHVDVKMDLSNAHSALISVVGFFEYICWYISRNYAKPIVGKFSHFERIDDQTYRIHMKNAKP